MRDEKKRKGEGGRGTYVRQACNHCRRRKSKCDGQEPVCGPCRDSGREAECTWGKETAKKARTQQHFESLVNRIKTLERRVKELEGELQTAQLPEGASTSERRASQSKSRDYTPLKTDPEDQSNGDEPHSSSASSNGGDSDIEKLIAPTKKLMLRESDLELYGPTSAFQMAPERKQACDCPPEACTHRIEEHLPAPHLSPSIDWPRHLPPEAPLTREEHDRLLHLFFCFFSGWCMRIVPEYFLRDMRRALTTPLGHKSPKSSHYSPMLHNSIFTIAPAYSDDPRLREVRFREHFARKAKEYIENDCEKPSIPVIMALSIIASYHATRGEQSLGYMYFGMSGRMAQALGLGIDCSDWVRSGLITEQDAIDRDWAFWGTITQDVCWSLYVGRGRCFVPREDNLTKVPIPFVNTEIDHAAWSCPPAKFPLQNSNIASIFSATCDLLRIGERVTEFVNGLGTDTRNASMQRVSELDIELNDWKDSLPPEVDLTASSRPVALPHRMTLHLTYWWLLILLHRPFYRRHRGGASDIDHVKLTNRAAENVMLIVSNWHNNYSIRFSPITIVQIIFSAGTVFVLSALQAISGPRLGRVTLTTSLNQIQTCLDYLAIIGESWDCSYRVREILLNIVDVQLKPRLLLRSGGTAPALPPPQSHTHSHGHIHTAPGSPHGSIGSQNASPQLDASSLPRQLRTQHTGSPTHPYSDGPYSPHWQSLHGAHSMGAATILSPSSPTGAFGSTHGSAIDVYGIPTSGGSSPYGAGNGTLGSGSGLDADMDITMNYPGVVMELGMAPYDTSISMQSNAYMPFSAPWAPDVYQASVVGGPSTPGASGLTGDTPSPGGPGASASSTSGGASSSAGGGATGANGPHSQHHSHHAPSHSAGGSHHTHGHSHHSHHSHMPPHGLEFSDEELAIMDQIVRQQQQTVAAAAAVQVQAHTAAVTAAATSRLGGHHPHHLTSPTTSAGQQGSHGVHVPLHSRR